MNTVETMPTNNLREPPQNFPLTKKEVVKFCQKWQITEFALFGSILRDDFTANSDVDILVIQSILGHGSSRSTEPYIHPSQDRVRKALEKLPSVKFVKELIRKGELNLPFQKSNRPKRE